MAEPQDLVETILEKDSHKRKPAWEWELIWEEKRYGALEGMHWERKREKTYNIYVALLCDIIDREPSTYEEAAEKKEWKEAMIKEYQFMHNDVWWIVLRPGRKYFVISKWIYKIKHAINASIEKHKEIFMVQGFS